MNDPVTVLVEYQIRPETTTLDDWLAEWRIRAEDARIGEPETSAYAAAVNADNALNVLVFERYANGDASLKAHVERPAHAALMETMGARNMTKRRVLSAMAKNLDHGWWSRGGAPDRRGVHLAVLNMRFRDEAHKAAFLTQADEHIEWCRSHEPESLIMGVGEAVRDADREIDLRTGDLLFVMGFADEAALRRHFDAAEQAAFSERVKAAGLQPENLFFRTYVSTGDGFLWRE